MVTLTGRSTADALGKLRAELLPDDVPRTFALEASPTATGGVVCIARKSEEGVTELLSLASHKLKTPLTALQIHLGHQLRVVQRQQPEREWLEKSTTAALEQTMRLTDTINTMLDVSRIDSGRWKLEPQDFDLGQLVRDTVERLRRTANESGCDVTCTVTGDTAGRFDRVRMEEVLANLLGNAFKHGARKPVSVTLTDLGSQLKLVVEDHGVGIDSDQLAKVFERGPRTALGLWITRQIVQAHHGQITLESVPGAGSTFTITLPKQPT